MSVISIRKLEAADASDYREIRLEALSRCPGAFLSSMAEDEGLPLARYEAALATHTVLGAFRNGTLQGVVALARSNFVRAQHKAQILGIYSRDDGDADEIYNGLVKTVIDGAGRDGLECLHARVPATDDALLVLYRRHDFESYGTESRALRLEDGRYVDHYLMCRMIARPGR